MTPKEKAEELLLKMYNTENCGITHFPNKHYCDCSEINIFQAKQCALICVDEIINTGLLEGTTLGILKKYWLEVKKEIENL